MCYPTALAPQTHSVPQLHEHLFPWGAPSPTRLWGRREQSALRQATLQQAHPSPALHGIAVLPRPPLSILSCRFPQQLLQARGSVSHLCSLFYSFSCCQGPSVPDLLLHTPLLQHAWPLSLSFCLPGSLFLRPALVAALVFPAGAPVPRSHSACRGRGSAQDVAWVWGHGTALGTGRQVSCEARGAEAVFCRLCPVSRHPLLPSCSGWVPGCGAVWAPSLRVQDPRVMGRQHWVSWLRSLEMHPGGPGERGALAVQDGIRSLAAQGHQTWPAGIQDLAVPVPHLGLGTPSPAGACILGASLGKDWQGAGAAGCGASLG